MCAGGVSDVPALLQEKALRAGHEASFAVQLNGARGLVDAKIHSPSGAIEDCPVSQLDSGEAPPAVSLTARLHFLFLLLLTNLHRPLLLLLLFLPLLLFTLLPLHCLLLFVLSCTAPLLLIIHLSQSFSSLHCSHSLYSSFALFIHSSPLSFLFYILFKYVNYIHYIHTLHMIIEGVKYVVLYVRNVFVFLLIFFFF